MQCSRVILFVALVLQVCATHGFESLIQAQGEVRKDLPAKPLPFAQPDWKIYHRTNHLHQVLMRVAETCAHAHAEVRLATPEDAGMSAAAGRDVQPPASAADGLLYLTVRGRGADVEAADTQPQDNSGSGAAARARKLASDLLWMAQLKERPAVEAANVTTIVLTFGEEGRDLLTSEIALQVLTQVCGANGTDVTPLPPSVRLVLVPVVNADGRRISEMGRRCDRANGNDVDVDRNWPTFWNEREDGDAVAAHPLREAMARRFTRDEDVLAPSTGGHPLSEVETRALHGLVTAARPTAFVTLRTGAYALTTPWDCKATGLQDAFAKRLAHMLAPISAAHCAKCTVGPRITAEMTAATGGGAGKRRKCGTVVDHVFGAMGVPFVFAWYVFDVSAPKGDCFRRHNPVSREHYERVVRNWSFATLNFSHVVANWVLLERRDGVDVANRNASDAAVVARERRARALADGGVDPEQEDDAHRHKGGWARHGSSDRVASIHDLHRAHEDVALKHSNPFAWVFERGQSELAAGNASAGRGTGGAGESSNGDETDRLAWLDGWGGVSAAFCMLVVCLLAAKQYVFKVSPNRKLLKRSRFLSRAPMKNA